MKRKRARRRIVAMLLFSWSSRATALARVASRRRTPRFYRPSSSLLWSPSADTSSSNSEDAALTLPHHQSSPIRSVAAPMVASSDYAFRCLCRQYGVDLTYTQMLHARNLLHDATFQSDHLDLYECACSEDEIPINGDTYPLDSELIPFTKGPLMVQLAGHDVDTLVRAADLIVEHTHGRVDGIDLNLGCPQGIARKGNYGAFLMEQDPETVYDILSALRQTLPEDIAVSAKIRLPLSDDALRDRIPRLLDTGLDFLSIHGRTLYENKTKVGACHVNRIGLAVETAQRHTPGFSVVANGGVEDASDVESLRQTTGACAVMSSEALLERPNLFVATPSSLDPRQTLKQQVQIARYYLRWCRSYPPVPGVLGHSIMIVKGHFFKFLHRYWQEQPDLRDRLASHKLKNLQQLSELLDEVEERYADLTDEQMALAQSFQAGSSWYRRHRKAVVHQRPVHLSSDLLNDIESPARSVDEQKRIVRERIAKLKAQRLEKGVKMKLQRNL